MLLCTIARVAKEKERTCFIVHALTYKPTVIVFFLSYLFLLSRFHEIFGLN